MNAIMKSLLCFVFGHRSDPKCDHYHSKNGRVRIFCGRCSKLITTV